MSQLKEAVIYALLNGVSIEDAKRELAKKPPHALIRDRRF